MHPGTAVLLASSDSDYITGETITVAGGIMSRLWSVAISIRWKFEIVFNKLIYIIVIQKIDEIK